jgi:hypothetical protein
MRKLLLGSTALAAAASLGANAALADVSISGAFEWAYTSMSSNVTAKDGTSSATDSEVAFKFNNKTDSGLTVGWVVELQSDDGDSAIDESSLSIAGGFGKVVLGGNDSVGDSFGIAGTDIPSEEGGTGTVSSATIGTNSDISPASGDDSKISYYLPAMGGLTMGVSHTTKVAGTTDSTEYGAKYTMDAGGTTITIGGASGTTEAATTDTDSQNIGVKIASGNITVAMGQGQYEASDEDRETNDFGASYNMGNGMVVSAYTVDSEDTLDPGEEFSRSGVEVAYTIAPGLSAVINVDDFDYKAGTSETSVSDNGTSSKLTIKASF